MHKRPLRRIHQADDAVIHAARQISGKVGEHELIAECRDARYGRLMLAPIGAAGARLGNKHPEESVALIARKSTRENPIDFQLGIFGQRWDLAALPAARLKAPSVIAALQLLAIEETIGERNAAMRTTIAQGEGLTVFLTAQH